MFNTILIILNHGLFFFLQVPPAFLSTHREWEVITIITEYISIFTLLPFFQPKYVSYNLLICILWFFSLFLQSVEHWPYDVLQFNLTEKGRNISMIFVSRKCGILFHYYYFIYLWVTEISRSVTLNKDKNSWLVEENLGFLWHVSFVAGGKCWVTRDLAHLKYFLCLVPVPCTHAPALLVLKQIPLPHCDRVMCGTRV